MTSTLVRDVGIALNDVTSKNASLPSSGKADFKEIWNQQTREHKNNGLNQKVETETSNIPKIKNALKSKHDLGQVTKHATDVDAEKESLSQEDLESIMEVLNTSAMNFLPQVAAELQISEEDLNYALQELGMEPMDLLKPENLTNLLLELQGEGDAMSLLTNEDLYQTLQKLTDQLGELMNGTVEELGISKEQLPIAFEEILQQKSKEPDVPVTLQMSNELPNENMLENVEEYNVLTEVESQPEQTDENQGGVINYSKMDTQQSEVQITPTPAGSNTQDQKDSAASSHSEHQQSNVFAQNVIDNVMKPDVAQVSETMFSEVDTEVIMKQIMDYMKLQVKPGFSTLEMQLHPESLGTLQVQISSKQGTVTAQFVTQNETIKAAIEGQIVQLRENFDQQGVKVDAIEVTVQSHEFERNLEHGREREQEAPDKKVRRKIDLTALTDIDELTEEEQITADIMTANGSTVDYTA